MLAMIQRYMIPATRSHPFANKRKKEEVLRIARRIMDQAFANSLRYTEDARSENRSEICAPALLQLCSEEHQLTCEPILVLTKNFSDQGVAVVARQSLDIGDSQIIFAIWNDGPLFFLGRVRQCHHLGSGFWRIGLELSEMISKTEAPELSIWAERLNPETRSE